jgi:glycosyltransferase involved in cell wall biosynthesis
MSKIEFIIPTWERPEELKLILQSLMVQTNTNWKAHVVIDGLTNDYRQVKDMYQNEERVKFSHVDGPNNDWGHTARNYGLDHAEEEWVVMTGDDNYYVPTFVDNFLQVGQTGKDLVYCDMVHDLKRDGYQPIKSKIVEGFIDIGNFMTRRSIIGDLRLITDSYQADFKFVNYVNKHKTSRVAKIDKVLYVHN